jgi:hypothetical protein
MISLVADADLLCGTATAADHVIQRTATLAGKVALRDFLAHLAREEDKA